jgi:hypothetical protein
VLAVFVLFFLVVFVYPRMTWEPQVAKLGEFSRNGKVDTLGSRQVPDSAEIFSAERIQKWFNKGYGGYLVLHVMQDPSHGGNNWTDTVWVKTAEGFEDPLPTIRRQDVQRQITIGMEMIRQYAGHRRSLNVRELIVDVTRSMTPWTVQAVRDRVNEFDFHRMVAKGDSVLFCGGRMGSNDQMVNYRCVMMGDGKLNLVEVNAIVSWLQIPPTVQEQSRSSFYTGAWNYLSKNAGMPNRRVVIISDAVENMPNYTISFYRDRQAVLDSLRWPQTSAQIDKQLPPPQLAGVEVELYGPPVPENETELVRGSLKFAANRLREMGAKVKMVF